MALPLKIRLQPDLARARSLLARADALVIAAGAGMGADSGLPTFRGNDGFWNAYPALGTQRMSFTSTASPDTFERDPRLAWGFYGHRLEMYREVAPHDGYRLLRELAARTARGAFVVTTNVDGHFERAGFPADAIWEKHGSIHRLQCLQPCGQHLWSARGFVPELNTQECRCENELPRCPHCGGLARPNIMMFGDGGWVEDMADSQQELFEGFASGARRVVVIELGAGTAIPSLRYLSQRRGWPVIRVNPHEHAVDAHNSVGLPMSALAALIELTR